MKLFSFKFAAIALAGVMAATSAVQAGDAYSDDDNGYSGYDRQSLRQFCYENPYDDACDNGGGYKKRNYEKRYSDYGNGNGNGHCAALIRSSGKRNLVTAFARNSARFAWRREVQAVHGGQYANWGNARNAHITCTNYGALKACTATATPCRN